VTEGDVGSGSWLGCLLFIVRPHPDDFDGTLILENLVNETVLYVNSPRIRAVQITDQFLERRRVLKRIGSQYLE